MADTKSDTERIEALWGGAFGASYVARNVDAGAGRGQFWQELFTEYSVGSVLEIGCNIGANLQWICRHVPSPRVYGVDISAEALAELRRRMPDVNSVWAPARELPFRDRWFDLVFTAGVLIHQPPDILPVVMAEIVRCSRRYVLCGEYYAETLTEVPYRGQSGALWKRDFGGLYQSLFPELVLRKTGFLSRADGGWDDVTFWLFEKPA